KVCGAIVCNFTRLPNRAATAVITKKGGGRRTRRRNYSPPPRMAKTATAPVQYHFESEFSAVVLTATDRIRRGGLKNNQSALGSSCLRSVWLNVVPHSQR